MSKQFFNRKSSILNSAKKTIKSAFFPEEFQMEPLLLFAIILSQKLY